MPRRLLLPVLLALAAPAHAGQAGFYVGYDWRENANVQAPVQTDIANNKAVWDARRFELGMLSAGARWAYAGRWRADLGFLLPVSASTVGDKFGSAAPVLGSRVSVGFKGSWAARFLVERGFKIKDYDRLTGWTGFGLAYYRFKTPPVNGTSGAELSTVAPALRAGIEARPVPAVGFGVFAHLDLIPEDGKAGGDAFFSLSSLSLQPTLALYF